MITAMELGCEAVKVFPADALGGPGFLRSMRSVFADLEMIPSGGIVPNAEQLTRWLRAGAAAVGIGSWLFPPAAIAANDWNEVSRRLHAASSAMAAARKESGG
jgi:2-dehydro-3-deoxyphosphogluconate aldolase/(4S)-4-hydroxy-2-oxoglutarate aldolase